MYGISLVAVRSIFMLPKQHNVQPTGVGALMLKINFYLKNFKGGENWPR